MKTNRRFLSILLILVMVLGLMQGMSLTAYADDYKLSVGGVQVTSTNAGNIDGTNTASYNADTNTLTLKGYSYKGEKEGVLYSGDTALNIEITGENTITSTSQGGCIVGMGYLIFSGTGTLFLLNRSDGGSAIHNKKDITIESGTVSANDAQSGIRTEDGKVTIKGGTVTATGNSGICAKKDVIISGGTVIAKGGSGTGISGETVTIKGGTVTATTNGNTTSGISSKQGTTISGGTVTATGGNGGDGAISGPVKNAFAGTGWTDTAGAEGKANIAISTEGRELTYKKVQFPGLPVASVTTAPASKDLTYNGSAQELITAGETTGGTMQYALGNESGATEAYTTSIPTKTDTGTYYVWYKAVGDDKHNDTDPAPLTVTISPADKTTLNKAIADAEAYYDTIKDRAEYAEVAAALKKAIDDAKTVATNDNVTESAVAQATKAVNDALDKAKADVAAIDRQAADEAAAKAVVDAIGKLPAEAGVDDKAAVEAARKAYEALTDDQKKLVPEDVVKKLADAEAQVKAAEADEAAAQAVIDAIGKLPAEAGVDDKAAVEAARKAYDALSDEQKALVPEDAVKKLTTAEEQVKAAEADEAAAQAVIDAIGKLPAEAGVDDKAAVEAARKAYDALSDEQKALVPEDAVKKLTDAEAQVKAAEADEATAQGVIEAIKALPAEAGLDDKAAVEAARKAYDALSDEQKALVPEDAVKKLADAEAQVKAAEADEAAAQAVIDAISALPAEAGLDDKAAVEAARKAYDALSDEQKKLVPEDVVKKLTDAEEQVQAAEEAAETISIKKCKITVKNRTYTGKAVGKPVVTVMYGKVKLKEGRDYTLTYNKKAKQIGTYKLIVEGKGNYKGSRNLTFKIVPKGTAFTKLTGGKKEITLEWKNPKNITGYQIQYSLKSNFSGSRKVTVKKAKTLAATVGKLKAGKKYYVRIRTYAKVKGKVYYSAWSKAKAVKTVSAKGNAGQADEDESPESGEDLTLPGIDIGIDDGMVDGIGMDGEIELTME